MQQRQMRQMRRCQTNVWSPGVRRVSGTREDKDPRDNARNGGHLKTSGNVLSGLSSRWLQVLDLSTHTALP